MFYLSPGKTSSGFADCLRQVLVYIHQKAFHRGASSIASAVMLDSAGVFATGFCVSRVFIKPIGVFLSFVHLVASAAVTVLLLCLRPTLAYHRYEPPLSPSSILCDRGRGHHHLIRLRTVH